MSSLQSRLGSVSPIEPSSQITGSAISIVNAIGTGFGGALGIDIPCRTRAMIVTRQSGSKNDLVVKGAIADKHHLVRKCVDYVERFLSIKLSREKTLVIEIDSDIPVAVGLKSSSAISTSVVSALISLLGGKVGTQDILELSCKASRSSGASITGAYDDAVSCLVGGLVLTDNLHFRVLKHLRIPEGIGETAIVRIPKSTRVYTSTVKKELFSPFRANAVDAFELAREGNIKGSMMLNSLIQCSVLGYSFEPILSAITEGSTCAGITGKGPAVAALCTNNRIASRVEKLWLENASQDAQIDIIRTKTVQPKEIMKT